MSINEVIDKEVERLGEIHFLKANCLYDCNLHIINIYEERINTLITKYTNRANAEKYPHNASIDMDIVIDGLKDLLK